MVHNGPIEMWIKFTVLGFFAFFAVYFFLFRAVWRRRHGTNYSDLLAWGAGSFLLGQFFVTVTVYEWPFGVWEKSILEFSCVAMIFCRHVDEASRRPRRRSMSATTEVRTATPDLSVLVPCYGYAHFLGDGIESVRLQGRSAAARAVAR